MDLIETEVLATQLGEADAGVVLEGVKIAVPRHGRAGRKPQRLSEMSQSSLVLEPTREDNAEVQMRLRRVGPELNCPLKVRDRLRKMVLALQCEADVDMSLGIIRRKLQAATIRVHRGR
jgi:hypothetical protein